MKFLINSFIVACFILALSALIAACQRNSRNVPDSPIPDEVVQFKDLPQGKMATEDWVKYKAQAITVQELPSSTVYYFPDGSIATERSYGSLPVLSSKVSGDSPSGGYRGEDCIGDMTVAIRCRNKEVLIVTGVPSCVLITFSTETQCVTFKPEANCSCGSRSACLFDGNPMCNI